MNFDEKMNRITAITDFYLNRFGRTQIGMFHLPTRDPNSYWFPVFINSLMITLRRKNVMPYNFWIRDPNAGCFRLIIWGNGYFRTDLSDIAPSVERFWAIHSPDPMAVLGSFSLSTESTVEDFSRFRKAAEVLNEWQVNAEDKLNLPADGTVEPPSCIFQNVRETLLEWCKLQNWDGYNHSGIRLHDRGQLYLLAGAGEKLRDNYQELHMMLMKARLTAYQDIFNSNDRGRLTIPEGTQDEIRLEYYDRRVRGCRCRQDRNSDLDWKYCRYESEAVRGLIEDLKKAGVTQTSPDGEGANTQA